MCWIVEKMNQISGPPYSEPAEEVPSMVATINLLSNWKFAESIETIWLHTDCADRFVKCKFFSCKRYTNSENVKALTLLESSQMHYEMILFVQRQ